MKAVVLLSIPGTGTNFVKELIEAHPAITHSVQWSALFKSQSFVHEEISLGAWSTGLDPNGTTLVWGHIPTEPRHMSFARSLMAFCPTVVPLRDPLLSLITRHQQGDSMDNLVIDVVGAWQWLALNKLNPLYFPVDQKFGEWERHDLGCYMYADLRFEGFMQGDVHWPFSDWTPVNSQGDYPLKTAYYAGDFDRIKAEIGQPVHYLQDIEGVLRPLLEREGYRELIWWT